MKLKNQTLRAGMQIDEELNPVQTTLYELIAAINAEVLPDEDYIVTHVVMELFETGQAKLLSANYNDAV